MQLGASDLWVISPLAVLALGLITLRLAYRLTRETGASIWSEQTLKALLPWLVACVVLVLITVVGAVIRHRKDKSNDQFGGNGSSN